MSLYVFYLFFTNITFSNLYNVKLNLCYNLKKILVYDPRISIYQHHKMLNHFHLTEVICSFYCFFKQLKKRNCSWLLELIRAHTHTKYFYYDFSAFFVFKKTCSRKGHVWSPGYVCMWVSPPCLTMYNLAPQAFTQSLCLWRWHRVQRLLGECKPHNKSRCAFKNECTPFDGRGGLYC